MIWVCTQPLIHLDQSQSDNNIEVQFHKKEPKTLEVLSFQLASAILPFVHYFEDEITDSDFDRFSQYATTNCNIFYDFARYISKNYLFNIAGEKEGKKR